MEAWCDVAYLYDVICLNQANQPVYRKLSPTVFCFKNVLEGRCPPPPVQNLGCQLNSDFFFSILKGNAKAYTIQTWIIFSIV